MEEKINYAWPVTTLCKYDYYALKKCMEENEKQFSNKKIILMGAGIRGTAFSILLKKFGYYNIAFTDNNEKKVGGTINEFPILPFSEIEAQRGQIAVIISVENGQVLKKQLADAGFEENRNFFYVESGLYDAYVEKFLEKKRTEYLLMGDCGITDISKTDNEFSNLGEMITEKLGEDQTKVLAVHAMGMRAFYHVLHAQIEYVEKPKIVAIMANFETFTGKQHVLPRSQHMPLIRRLSDAVENRDIELAEYADVTKERFENFKMDYFTSSKDTVKKMNSDRNDRIVIRMNYMYELQEENECIVYLKKIISLCKEQDIKLFFFIPPANYQYAEELFGEKFGEKYNANVEKLKQIVNDRGIQVLDLSYALNRNQFASTCTIDETTNYEGRVITSEAIAGMMRGMK